MRRPIYMDYQATTPVDRRVMAAMVPYFCERFGNPASRTHRYGWEAEEAVERAREQVAHVIGARSKEIIFTSGATEANNLAIRGVVEWSAGRGRPHVITGVTEHKAVLDTCKALERAGKAAVTYVRVDRYGRVDPDDVRRAIRPETVLIALMYANNEVGTLHPIREIGQLAKARGIWLHCDATQGVGKVEVDVERDGIDLLALSGHKLYGPKGSGALYLRSQGPRVRVVAQQTGGGQERGVRAGTLNVPGIVGLGEACALSAQERAAEGARVVALRQRLYEGLVAEVGEVELNGHPQERIPGNLHVSFAGVEGEAVVEGVREEIAVSTGSACTSATLTPSHVLQALGLGEEAIAGAVRFGLGRFTTAEEVEYVIGRLGEVVRRLRALAPPLGRERRPAASNLAS